MKNTNMTIGNLYKICPTDRKGFIFKDIAGGDIIGNVIPGDYVIFLGGKDSYLKILFKNKLGFLASWTYFGIKEEEF